MPRMPTLADVNAARARLEGIALHKPLEVSRELADATDAVDVRLKREEVQPTCAFKTRGAHNKVAIVASERPEAALVTASSGNHGIAVATAAMRHDMRLTVLVERSPDLRLIGVQPAASPPMYAHFETGSTDPMPIAPTLADGVAGNIGRNVGPNTLRAILA